MSTRRTVPVGLAAVLALASAVAGGGAAHAAVVITVAKSGGQYTSVQAAVNAVPNNSSTAYTISIGAGTYSETVSIPASKLHLTLLGATGNSADVVIAASNYAGEAKSGGGTYGTLGSATVNVAASNFTAKYITFANEFDKNSHPGVADTQAVALAMQGDRQVYESCKFYGHQDTLLSWSNSASVDIRQYVYGSIVDGDVDFIFGNGTLVIDRSTVNVENDGQFSSGSLAAPATYNSLGYGILITGSTVNSSLAANTVDLGRAWEPYSGVVPQEVVRNTALPASVINAQPWVGISGSTWTSGRYYEYENSGAGAAVNGNRPQLSGSAAANYTAAKYLAGSDGWNPVAP
jgi:pectin methylesterase-like acyl-CoA thioesterase